MRVCTIYFFLAGLALALAKDGHISHDMVTQLTEELFDFRIRENPGLAGIYGIDKYQNTVEEWNPAAFDRRIIESRKYLAKVEEYLSMTVEKEEDVLTLKIMRQNLQKFLAGSKFMKFPLKNKDLLPKWIVAVRREGFMPTIHSRICSDHFITTDYAHHGPSGKPQLNECAVPSVFDFPSHLQPKRPRKRCRPLDSTAKESGKPSSTTGDACIPTTSQNSSDHPYTTTFEQAIDDLTKKNVKLRTHVKALGHKVRRQQKTIAKLSDLLNDLKEKKLIETEPASVMAKCFDGTVLQLFQNEKTNGDRPIQGRRYTDQLKQFATTLHYYSPQAYKYCRTILSLPDPSSIRNWLSNINCDPGFMTNVLNMCSQSDTKDFSLVIDSMSLHKQATYSNGKFVGFCDYGGILAEDSDVLASEALVFLLVPLAHSQLQYPVGYFLVDKVNSQVQLELVNTLLRLTAEKGIRIRNITCDGAASNQSMLSRLGALLDPTDPHPYFAHPILNYKVYATLDICHMLKLARNCLAEFHCIRTSDHQQILWRYIENLSSLQEKDLGVHLGNKLSAKHIQWRKQKMKVKLAAQTFSRSVSDALQFLSTIYPERFGQCDATVEFIRQMDTAFDILNSRSTFGKWNKAAITQSNIKEIEVALDSFSQYLLSLSTPDGQPLYLSRRKTFVVGFICTAKAITMLAHDLFAINSVKSLPAFRISQDFIETLFSKIRRMGGHNNNPTAILFKSALRNLLAKTSIAASANGNSVECDSVCGVFNLERSKRTAPIKPDQIEFSDDLPDEMLSKLSNTPRRLSFLHENIMFYMAGYMIRSMKGKLACSHCIDQLVGCGNGSVPGDHSYSGRGDHYASLLTNIKDRGGLTFSSLPVFQILCRCESLLQTCLSKQFISGSNPLHKLICLFNKSTLEERPVKFFRHTCDVDHTHELSVGIAKRYFDIRLKHFSRLFNRTIVRGGISSDRSRLNRLIIFKNI